MTSWPFKGRPSACRSELLSGCEGSIPSGTVRVLQATATFFLESASFPCTSLESRHEFRPQPDDSAVLEAVKL